MEPNSQPTSNTPAPYGQACMNCSRAKCKCVISNVGGSCERCHRLNKECRPSATVRKRKAKRSKVSKTSQLEEKLDGLVSLLKSATQPTPVSENPNTTAVWDFEHDNNIRANNTVPPGNQIGETVDAVFRNYLPDRTVLTPAATGSVSTSCHSPTAAVAAYEFEPTPDEAEEYLEIFRTQKSKYFPFVYIPSSTSARQLRQERPFLWLSIMAVTAKSTSQQLALGTQARRILAQKLVVEYERSLDLLLGVLTYIAWGNCQLPTKPFMHIFTQLAISVVFGLGLNKPPPKEPHGLLFQKEVPSSVRTMEDRRAVLGCFLITSSVSSFLQKTDALRWTPYMDECLQTLAEKQECPTDQILVQQVRLQLIVEKVSQAPWHDGEIENADPTRAPPAFYLKALQSQLLEVKHKIPPELHRNEIVLSHVYHAELTVNEIALCKAPIITTNSDFQRLESLCVCLNSIKSWLDIFFSTPPAAFIGLSFSIFAQFGHCLLVLYRLSTLDDPAWDKDMVRNTADLLLILDRTSNKLREGAELAGVNTDTGENMFTKAAEKLQYLKQGWEAKLTVVPTGPAVPSRQDAEEIMPGALLMDFSDDAWLTDMVLSWDH